jgi:hypothetical protein
MTTPDPLGLAVRAALRPGLSAQQTALIVATREIEALQAELPRPDPERWRGPAERSFHDVLGRLNSSASLAQSAVLSARAAAWMTWAWLDG